MILSIPGNWHKATAQHTAFINLVIDNFLAGKGPLPTSAHTVDFVTFCRSQIVSHAHADLRASIEVLLTYKIRLSPTDYSALLNDLQGVFNYNQFSQKHRTRWDAYKLCHLSQTRTCPYCNHNFSFTVYKDKRGVFRPTLDHFYPKALYPHLALTLPNLIPSCYTCNSSLKGDIDFFFTPHLHPLFDVENIRFRCHDPLEKITGLAGNLERSIKQLDLCLEPIEPCDATHNSLACFALSERYQVLAFEAANFITQKTLTEALIHNLTTVKPAGRCPQTSLNLSVSSLQARLLGFERSEYGQYLLGRLYADLHDQFKRDA